MLRAAPALRSSLSALGRSPKLHLRRIWQNSTILSHSPESLLSSLDSLPLPVSKSPVLLFALSKNVPSELVSSIRSTLSKHATSSIGCLSEVVPTVLVADLAPEFVTWNDGEAYSLSVAIWDESSSSAAGTVKERVVPFLSSLSGRPNISVGREIKSGSRADSHGENVDAGFEAFLRGEKWGFGEATREGKKGVLAELKDFKIPDVKQMIVFTADRTQPVLSTLSTYTSSATIGLVGSSTPFHSPTNAPFSLFYNDQTLSSGAVGIAVINESTHSVPISVEYSGLSVLGEPMEVTSAKGNIVLTLSEQNAARLLLKAVQDLPSSSSERSTAIERAAEKEKEFFAAVFEQKPSSKIDLSKARHVSKIMAGDPSRGAMSVETEEEVKVGYWVVFLHRPLSSDPLSSPSSTHLSTNSLSFLSIAPSESSPGFVTGETPLPSQEDTVRIEGFVAASENGVVLSRVGSDNCWVCKTEGVVAKIE